jgi:hypothetical protein
LLLIAGTHKSQAPRPVQVEIDPICFSDIRLSDEREAFARIRSQVMHLGDEQEEAAPRPLSLLTMPSPAL